jgi:RimJ/RimL family protein N-acetyltransferase
MSPGANDDDEINGLMPSRSTRSSATSNSADPDLLQAAVKLRAATLEDVNTVREIEAAFRPDEPLDPVVLRYEWETPEPGTATERWMAEVDGRPVGYAMLFHPDWSRMTDRDCIAWLGWLPESASILPVLIDFVEGRARAQHGSRLQFYCQEDESAIVAALTAAGYRLDTTAKVWELDLRKNRDRLLALADASRAAMAAQGIRLIPLSEHAAADPLRELYEAHGDSRLDMPRSHEIMPVSYEAFRGWHGGPDHRADRTWIALDGDRIVGMSFLRFPPAGGRVWTGFTGTVRSYRGRGIARAVKMETLAQAIELGVGSVRTDNDERNAPMLHINEELGYTRLPAFADYEKDL